MELVSWLIVALLALLVCLTAYNLWAPDSSKKIRVYGNVTPPKASAHDIIYQVTLIFPHGLSSDAAQSLAHRWQEHVGAGISAGGFDLVEGAYWDDGPKEWAKESMNFVFGHKLEGKENEV